jgi:hypothetical protein
MSRRSKVKMQRERKTLHGLLREHGEEKEWRILGFAME